MCWKDDDGLKRRCKTGLAKVMLAGLIVMVLISSAALAALKPSEVANKALVKISILGNITAKDNGAVQDVDATSKATVKVGKVTLWPGTPLKGKITVQGTSSEQDMAVTQYILELNRVDYGGNKPPVSFTEGKVVVKETTLYGKTQSTVTVSDVYIY